MVLMLNFCSDFEHKVGQDFEVEVQQDFETGDVQHFAADVL